MSNNANINSRRTGTVHGYTRVPDSFLQDEKISHIIKQVCIYLQRFPDAWTPMPDKIQQHFRFTKAGWKRIYKELVDEGYVKFNNGIDGHRRPFLEFDIFGGLK